MEIEVFDMREIKKKWEREINSITKIELGTQQLTIAYYYILWQFLTAKKH